MGEMFAIGLMLVGLLLVTFDKGKPVEEENDMLPVAQPQVKPIAVARQPAQPVRIKTLGEVAL